MKILAVSDMESREFYDYGTAEKLAGFGLILACGDLRREYLEFLVTMARCPVVYIHGNHDDAYDDAPPEGCVCAEDRIYVHEGIRILGLGGSYRYRNGAHMYTEGQMARRVARLQFQLWKWGASTSCSPTRRRGTSTTLTPGPTGVFSALCPCWTSTARNTSSTGISTRIMTPASRKGPSTGIPP